MEEKQYLNVYNENNALILEKIDSIVSNRHLSSLSDAPIIPYEDSMFHGTTDPYSCLFPIRRIVYDKQENSLGKMTSMYIGAASAEISPVLVINHPKGGLKADFYFGVCGENDISQATTKADVFRRNLIGNFPGCQIDNTEEISFLSMDEQKKLLDNCFSKKYRFVSSVSGIASTRQDIKKENEAFIQGIERVVDGMEDQSYSVFFIARNITNEEISDMQAKYENIYNQLYPYLKTAYSVNSSNANTISKTISDSLSEMVSRSVSKTLSKTMGTSDAHSDGGHTDKTKQTGTSTDSSGGFSGGFSAGLFSGGVYYGENSGLSESHSKTRGTSWNDTFTKSVSESESGGEADTSGKTTTVVHGEGSSFTITEGKTIQISRQNKIVQGLLEALEQKIKRLRDGKSLGMFAVAAYFIAEDAQSTKAAASIYKATITGNHTSIEDAAINTWQGDDYTGLCEYLKRFQHPLFKMKGDMVVTPASVVTSEELSIQIGLPKSSITGLPVSESVSFGRSITLLDGNGVSKIDCDDWNDRIELGKLFHLGKSGSTEVSLGVQSLTMHTFITGTTGSGKSNTVYWILKRLTELPSNVHFMVIEPAKGEYKSVFGDADIHKPRAAGRPVHVYGTNPKITPLLRINPFSFCPEVHVLEHIDRLVGIFNVCWPMEAAMPAILKQAVEKAYMKAGWNLKQSVNSYGASLYPSFFDVMQEVEQILNESEYSGDNKGDYKGALCTRLRELTTGLNSMMFCSNELDNHDLFDQDVIIDLSRLSSSETKSLVMGLLVIRLQEYRQSNAEAANSVLQHVTVLEEAHHLLKRTSTQQSMDSANILGKSVEMISNSLAELRSCGEGFIIADQSPEQVDMSAVKNTNTKIILRLPVYEDRKLVGKAIGLNDSQIAELAKLPTGIAAVYQNNWLDAVLVNVDKFSGEEKWYKKQDEDLDKEDDDACLLNAVLHRDKRSRFCNRMKEGRECCIERLNLPVQYKQLLLRLIREPIVNENDIFAELAFLVLQMPKLMEEFLDENADTEVSDEAAFAELWEDYLSEKLKFVIQNLDYAEKKDLLLGLSLKSTEYNPLFGVFYDGLRDKYENVI